MRSKIAVALLLGTLAFTPGIAMADDHSLEQLAIESADTPAEHTALAKHYRAKAAKARENAKSHEDMARIYGLGPVKLSQKTQMEQHCKKMAANAESTAAEYEGLAKAHEEEAKKAK